MSLFCKLGLHDFEVVQWITPKEVIENLFTTEQVLEILPEVSLLTLCHSYEDCICRCCGKTEESIDEGIREMQVIGERILEQKRMSLEARYAARQRVRNFRRERSCSQ